MTEKEKIKALKENKMAFGLMDKELQEKATEIGGDHFLRLNAREWMKGGWVLDSYDRTYRLRQDYDEEPEVIELEIYRDNQGDWCVNGYLYTNAPAICPKEGYRFVGYRYKDMDCLYIESCMYINMYGVKCKCKGENKEPVIVFPTHAVYKRIK